MKQFFSILLLSVLVSPLVSFAETAVTTIDATVAPVAVSAETSEKPEGKKLGVVNKIKNKIKNKKEKKEKKEKGAKLEALTLTSEQISCISEAMKVRDTAQDKADTDGVAMIKEARWARNAALTSALSLSGEARIKANATARQDFQSMVKKTNEWKRNAMKTAAETFRSTVKDSCKVTSSDQLAVESESKEVEDSQ